MPDDELRDRRGIVERELRQRGCQRHIGGDGDHIRESLGCSSGLPAAERCTSIFGIGSFFQPSTITRSHGEKRCSSSSRVGSGTPRNSCIRAQRRDELTRTSPQPASRWRCESLPGWSTSNW